MLLERIQAVTNLPVAWLLLVFCAASRANCYLRVVHPRLVRTFAGRHDAAVWRCLQELSGIEGDGTTLDLAQLPFHCGGLSLLQLCSSLGELKWKPSDWWVNWQQRGVSSESWANCPPSGATFSAVSVCWTSVMPFQHGSRALVVSAQANHTTHPSPPSQVCLAKDGNSLRLHAMFGQTWLRFWPNLVLAKLGLAKLGLGFGQRWCWPNLVWPKVGVGQTWQNSMAQLRFGQSWKQCTWVEFSRTGTTIVVVLPDRISGICCSGASTRCDTVVYRATQCDPTGTATILDDTHSRNCGFFGPVTFPESHVAQVLQCLSSWIGGEHLSGPPTRIVCSAICVRFLDFMVGDPMRTVREWTTSRFCCRISFTSPFVNMQVETPVASCRSPFQNAATKQVVQAVQLWCRIHL